MQEAAQQQVTQTHTHTQTQTHLHPQRARVLLIGTRFGNRYTPAPIHTHSHPYRHVQDKEVGIREMCSFSVCSHQCPLPPRTPPPTQVEQKMVRHQKYIHTHTSTHPHTHTHTHTYTYTYTHTHTHTGGGAGCVGSRPQECKVHLCMFSEGGKSFPLPPP